MEKKIFNCICLLNDCLFAQNQTCTLLRSCMEIADSGCCCFRVAVSCGGGGAGILFAMLLLSVFVFELSPFASPFVECETALIGGGRGGGRGGSGHAV